MDRETRLRETLVAQMERAGVVCSRAVAAAMRAVPRHLFLPELPAEETYADRAIALKSDGDDIVSSISQPSMIAQMLELLQVRPGDRVLEVGTGSGYNAALLSHLAGPDGSVTSIELDGEMCARAARTLAELGYDRVRVVGGDGAAAVDVAAAYDRIAITARCDDIAASWWDALVEGGRMVIPLRLAAAGEFAVGFERRGDRLHGVGAYPCAFIALRGEGTETADDRVFFRDASRHPSVARARSIASIEAVRARDATPQLLEDADAVVARPVTMFGIRF
jgi:protein-L-isoaspartate(D-aspartate) O-methyltransferase